MDFDRMQEFVTVADKKSIKKAAEELSISPATLSARLLSLEKSLNSTLFTRTNTGVELTEAGERFYVDAVEIVSSYHHLKAEITSFSQTPYNHIRIAVAGSGLPFYLGPYLDMVNQRQPTIKLDIMDDSFCSIEEGLNHDLVDMYFAPVMSHIAFENIHRYTLSVAHQYVVLPVGHRLANHSSVSMRDLDQECFILYPKSSENCIRNFQIENITAAKIHYSIYETESSARLYKLLVPIGKGLMLTPFSAMDAPPNTVTLPLHDITYSAPSSLFVKKTNIRPEVQHFVKEFLKFVKETSAHEHRKAL
ncbi:MAG: LysR family transcriptional regulator [Lachnospiraceae bacterium]